jgi:trehalose synthase
MWKRRPVVATRVGGIVDQIVDDEHGLLIDDPADLASFGAALNRLLGDAELSVRLAANAYERAHTEFLGDKHLERYGTLFAQLLG